MRPNGKPYSWCKECQRAYSKKHYKDSDRSTEEYRERKRRNVRENRRRIRELIVATKSVPCADCGVQYPPYVMDFDHVRGKKLFNVGTAGARHSFPQVEREIKKCEVVCANCHRERTHQGGGGIAAPPGLDPGEGRCKSGDPDNE